MVDYYGSKLKRFDRSLQQLYLQERSQKKLERLTDGFIHHVRKMKEQAKTEAKEAVYQDWQKAARNVEKAAELL